ncbi:SusC/RagA family TonB-linked outer membrane protein [Pedobacter immunditicola]|uniref:SusC/RagA family TonB-linked outer membrane protein n=1 Tax=Pedobacter immunditicola TaxID=3133440 RepID=UPI0030B65BE8
MMRIKQEIIPFSSITCISLGFVLVLMMSFKAEGHFKENRSSVIIPVQEIAISGKVTSSDGIGIPGVTIQVKGTTIRRTTSQDGSYSITIPKTGSTLVFSYIGMKTQERVITNQKVVNISLETEATSLENVVVVGYGAVKKPDLTGSVAQVDMKDLLEAPVASFDEALAGRVAGVQVSSSDGQPGGRMEIVVRGANSLTQSTSPLYVIDGFPIEDPDNAAINPEEIESINILKDASATAIYGSRGANGVIIIQTKKGKIGKPVIAVNTSLGFQQVQKTMEMMTPWEFVNLQMEVHPTNTMKIYTPRDIDSTSSIGEFYNADGRTLEDYRNVKGTDWQDLIFKQSPMQNHNISIRGGNSLTKYSLSGSLFDQQGIILNTGSKRTQGRITIDQTISKKLKAGITANYSENIRFGQPVNQGAGGTFTSYLLYQAWAYRPVSGNSALNLEDVQDDDAEYVNPSDLRFNPKVTSENDFTRSQTTNFSSNLYVEYDIFKNLKLRSTGAISNTQVDAGRFYNSNTPQGSPRNNGLARQINGSSTYTESNIWSNENTLTYNTTIMKNHKVDIMGGLSFQEDLAESYGFAAQKIPKQYEPLGINGLGYGEVYSTSPVTGASAGLASLFGRLNYNYKSKYLLTATFRADGSSKFYANNRWGYFPSGAFAWNMQKEGFMSWIKPISEAKFRVSYGETGNNRIGMYEYLSVLTNSIANTYPFDNDLAPSGGIAISKLGNQELKWETTKQFNVGYDLGLFKNRISLTFDYYKKTTRDLLLFADMPSETGYTRSYKNIGSIMNEGLEFTLNTTNVRTKNFTWRSNFNISFNENKILALTRNQASMFSQMTVAQNTSDLYLARVGYPAGMFYGYIFDGIYQVEDFDFTEIGGYSLKGVFPDYGANRANIQPGHIKYRDINEDGLLDGKDRTIIGRGQPLHTGGFSNNFSYKGFYLNVFLQWSYGNDVFNANRMMFDGNAINIYNVNQYASAADRWTPENRSNILFKQGGQGPAGNFSDRVIEDASYLRLKTVSLNYSIPKRLITPMYLTNLSFRVSAQNLLTLTNYSGMDPEVSVRHSVLTPGYDYSPYPQARTITFGLNATF